MRYLLIIFSLFSIYFSDTIVYLNSLEKTKTINDVQIIKVTDNEIHYVKSLGFLGKQTKIIKKENVITYTYSKKPSSSINLVNKNIKKNDPDNIIKKDSIIIKDNSNNKEINTSDLYSISASLFPKVRYSKDEISKMTTFEKEILYKNNYKSPIVSVILNLAPSLGYAYIDDWKRGLYFIGAKLIIPTSVMIFFPDFFGSYDDCNSDCFRERFGTVILPASIFLGIYIYEGIDLYNQVNKYNQKLNNKIFGKKDNKLSYLLLPTSDGAYLNLSYKF